jgi:hypothetical protein
VDEFSGASARDAGRWQKLNVLIADYTAVHKNRIAAD